MIVRFRSGSSVLIGDVKKMFWQISNKDQKYHGIIYKGETYVFTRICFGNKPSPSIAELSMVKAAQSGKDSHPIAYPALLYKRYMDDIIDADDHEIKIVSTRDQMTDLIGRFDFEIEHWYSNNPNVGNVVEKTKVVGLTCNLQSDTLTSVLQSKVSGPITKRRMLAKLSEIWDPLGICKGTVLTGKLLLKVGWDDTIRNYPDLVAQCHT